MIFVICILIGFFSTVATMSFTDRYCPKWVSYLGPIPGVILAVLILWLCGVPILKH